MMMLVLFVGFKIIKRAFQLLQSQSRINEVDCGVPENIHTPPPKEGTFALNPHPLGISIPWGACHTLLLGGISIKNISVKNAVALYHYVK